MTFHAFSGPTLLRVARGAAVEATEPSTKTIVAIVFALTSLEAFVNELLFHTRTSSPENRIDGLRELAIESAALEKSRASIGERLDDISLHLAKTPADFSRRPLQDLCQLQRIRNLLVHPRAERLATQPAITASGAPTHHQVALHKLGRFLVNRGIIEEQPQQVITALLSLLHAPAVGRWAHDTVVQSMLEVLNWLPSDGWRSKVSFAYDLSTIE